MPPKAQPIGQQTRGKTARNRLRRADIFLTRFAPALIKQPDPPGKKALFVDLGFGATPHTTLESANHFWKLNPSLGILGVEIDPDRVSSARGTKTDQIDFRLGGFNLPLKKNETVRLIRAFNVLRQYDETDYLDSIQMMTTNLIVGGMLIEGTSDPFGRVWAANLFRKVAENKTDLEALIFSTNFRISFNPADFQPVLPKNLIHHMAEPSPILGFFNCWKAVALEKIHYKAFSDRQWFIETANRLADEGYQLDLRKKMLKSGFLTWLHPDI